MGVGGGAVKALLRNKPPVAVSGVGGGWQLKHFYGQPNRFWSSEDNNASLSLQARQGEPPKLKVLSIKSVSISLIKLWGKVI